MSCKPMDFGFYQHGHGKLERLKDFKFGTLGGRASISPPKEPREPITTWPTKGHIENDIAHAPYLDHQI